MPGELVPFDLIDRCKGGDEVAWAELVELTYREVYTLCLRILRDPDDAAEATQDAYLKAWRGLKGFRGDSQFTTWLYRVASNAALSIHRSRKRRRDRESDLMAENIGEVASTESTEGSASTRLELDRIDAALAGLPEHHRSAIVLRDIYGLSMEEIATQLKISETAAKVRVHRARKKLKDALYEDEGGDER